MKDHDFDFACNNLGTEMKIWGKVTFFCFGLPLHLLGGTGDVNRLAALSAGGFGFVTAILPALTGLAEAE